MRKKAKAKAPKKNKARDSILWPAPPNQRRQLKPKPKHEPKPLTPKQIQQTAASSPLQYRVIATDPVTLSVTLTREQADALCKYITVVGWQGYRVALSSEAETTHVFNAMQFLGYTLKPLLVREANYVRYTHARP